MNLNQVTIYTEKPVETAEFYQKLGLKLIVDSLPRYARLLCPDGDSTLSVHISEESSAPSNIVLYFECEDLNAKVSELKNAGIEFESEPTIKPGFGAKAISKTRRETRSVFSARAKIAKIRRGVYNRKFEN